MYGLLFDFTEQIMVIIFSIIAVIELILGISVFITAKSAIHEILATLMIGFSFLTFILGAILAEIKSISAITKEILVKKITN